jgi:DNA-binding transcriptional LysR family regulator
VSRASSLGDLRLSDLVTFLTVLRTSSVSATAREIKVTPSQVSKAIARLEHHYRVRLLNRGRAGMSLTEDGRDIAHQIGLAVTALAASSKAGTRSASSIELTMAGPSYLLGPMLAAVAAARPQLVAHGVELAPAQIRVSVTENLFDVALAPSGIPSLPRQWTSEHAGAITKVLLGPPMIADRLAPFPASLRQIRELPFVGPVQAMGARFARLGDDCPLPVGERRIVHRVQTIGAALELAARASCVAFGPVIAARRMLQTGELVVIPVEGWNESEPLYLAFNGDVVLDRLRRMLVTVIRGELARTG